MLSHCLFDISCNHQHRASSLITKHNGKKTLLLQSKWFAELIVWKQTVAANPPGRTQCLQEPPSRGLCIVVKKPLCVHRLLREHVHEWLRVSLSLSEARCV